MNNIRKKPHARNKLRKADIGLKIRDAERRCMREAGPKFEPEKPAKRNRDARLMFFVLGSTFATFVLILTCITHVILGLLNIIYFGVIEINRLVIGGIYSVFFGILFCVECPIAWAIIVECAQKCFRKKR